jgi:hypothetical protein
VSWQQQRRVEYEGTVRTARNEHGGGEGILTEVGVARVPSENEGALSIAEAVLLQGNSEIMGRSVFFMVYLSPFALIM